MPRNVDSVIGPPRDANLAVRSRSMAPKEHGAWGQLGFPLLVSLGIGRPGLVAVGMALSAVALFMAHEPLVVLLGQRGTRAVREAAAVAKLRLGITLGLGGTLGATAWFSAEPPARLAALVCFALGLVAFGVFLIRGRERSTLGELWIAWTLSASGTPVALASGAVLPSAILCWISFALAYSAGVFGIRGLIRDHRESKWHAGWFGLASILVAILGLSVLSQDSAFAALSFWGVVAGSRLARPSLKSLRRIGWLLIGASVVQAAWLLWAFRASA